MYGLLIVGVQHYVEMVYGSEMWNTILHRASPTMLTFQTQKVYPESIIERLFGALSEETGKAPEDLTFQNGLAFATFTSEHGYEKLLRVHGRDFVNFLNNLDNLHEFLRLSYPKIKPPSFFVRSSTENYIELEYSTKRQGYVHYVRGQLVTLAKRFYNLEIEVQSVGTYSEGLVHYNQYRIYNLRGRGWGELNLRHVEKPLTCWGDFVSEREFFGTCAFYLVLTDQMIIRRASQSFKKIDPHLENANFSDKFLLARPYINPTMDDIKLHRHNTFELVLVCDPSIQKSNERGFSLSQAACKFKGEMRFVEEWNMILFLGAPAIRDLKQLSDYGLYICDLNMFDRTRDIILSGGQLNDELIELFRKQQEKSKELEKSMRRLDKMNKLTDQLLYQCIPRGVAEKLRNGIPAMETIESFESVSICFTKVVNFSAKCMHINVEQVINLLNNMYTLYDALTECHNVYKVETVGDSYMLVSGAPQRTPYHPAHITEMALDILETTQQSLAWPPLTSSDHLSDEIKDEKVKLYIGCHTGSIVAGIIGYKAPRYCLFGDAVNTASRMMSNGLPDRIHVSVKFAEALSEFPYNVEYRGELPIKGKGTMQTYFVNGRKSDFKTIDPTTNELASFADILKADIEHHQPVNEETSTSLSSDTSVKPVNNTQKNGCDALSEHTSEDNEDESEDNFEDEDLDVDFDSASESSQDDAEVQGQRNPKESKINPNFVEKKLIESRSCASTDFIHSISPLPKATHSNDQSNKVKSDITPVVERIRKCGTIQPGNMASLTSNVEEDKVNDLLKEAVRRLTTSPFLQTKKAKPRLRGVKFDTSSPDVISHTVFEAEVYELGSDTDPQEVSKGVEETSANTVNRERSTRRDSLELVAQKVKAIDYPNKKTTIQSSTEYKVEKFRKMMRAKMFRPMTPIVFQSSEASIFNELAEPLSLALTELIIVRPKDPIHYLGNWLWQYSKKTL